MAPENGSKKSRGRIETTMKLSKRLSPSRVMTGIFALPSMGDNTNNPDIRKSIRRKYPSHSIGSPVIHCTESIRLFYLTIVCIYSNIRRVNDCSSTSIQGPNIINATNTANILETKMIVCSFIWVVA